MRRRTRREAEGGPGRVPPTLSAVSLGVSILSLTVSGCVATDAGPTTAAAARRTITVLTVDNPQMIDLIGMTERHFTPETGIRVVFRALSENDLRHEVEATLGTGPVDYDVVGLGSYDLQVYGAEGSLRRLDAVMDDPAFEADDLLPPVRAVMSDPDGHPFGVPFYGESSFLMYNREVVDEAGLTVPEHPTWRQVARLAARLDGARPGMRGICLRGLPGWGEMLAPLLTVVNTFGGTLFHADWSSGVGDPAFRRATSFYLDLIREHGFDGAAQAGYTECLEAMSQGRVALWYDATAAAGLLEDPERSAVAGRIGYADAPTDRTTTSGWLFAWAWGVPAATGTGDAPADAERFIAWAGSRDYEALVGQDLGWQRVPDGKRFSTYGDPRYLRVAAGYASTVRTAITSVDPTDPGVQPRPYVGVQYVPIREFATLGDALSQRLNAVLADTMDLDEALASMDVDATTIGASERSAGTP